MKMDDSNDAAPARILRQMREIARAQKNRQSHPHDLGVKHLQIEDYEAAERAFRQAIAEKPNFSFSHHGLGEALRGLNRTAEAQAALERAVELNPLHAPSFRALGDLFAAEGKSSPAVEAYRRALELQPGSVKAVTNLARLLIELSPDNENAAAETFWRALKHEPKNLALYRAALDFFAPDADLYAALGENLAAHHLPTPAIFFFRLAAQIAPDKAEIWRRLAQILSAAGEVEAAEIYLRRAAPPDSESLGAAAR